MMAVSWFLCVFTAIFAHVLLTVWSRCGPQACHPIDPDAINIHLVPHTHDDVGWIATVGEYYKSEVRSILDTVTEQLLRNNTYRFTYVEMAFFEMWWNQQTAVHRAKVRQLVEQGRLQFALGGWVSADEAVVHYADLIEQLSLGRAFLRQTFGSCVRPRAAWQVDPFGHSSGHAAVFLDAGYDAMYFQRMDFREKQFRRDHRQLELLWDVVDPENYTSPVRRHLFTNIFYRGYCFPSDICLSEDCAYTLTENTNTRGAMANKFLEHVKKWIAAYRFNHILVPVGCDFSFRDAEFTFNQINALIELVNHHTIDGTRLHVFYSTPDCYTTAVNTACQSVKHLPERKGDFLPYEEKPQHYWTGFYTSRPALKAYVRENALLQTVADQLSIFVDQNPFRLEINELRKQLAVLQHHDAITGTETEHVAQDYLFRLHSRALPVQHAVSRLIDNLSGWQLAGVEFCDLRNISVCSVTERTWTERIGFAVTVYNPLGWDIHSQQWLRVPVHIPTTWDTDPETLSGIEIDIVGSSVGPLQEIPVQLFPVSDRTKSIPERQLTNSPANAELIFSPTHNGQYLPAMGYVTFHVTLTTTQSAVAAVDEELEERDIEPDMTKIPVSVSNSRRKTHLRLDVEQDQVILSVIHQETGKRIRVAIDMMYYLGSVSEDNPSGAYVFQPRRGTAAFNFISPKIREIEGPCLKEILVQYTAWAEMRVRHYFDDKIEIEWTVGPIPDGESTISHEIIIRYRAHGAPELLPDEPGEFFTDSAGRHLIRRVRNQRPNWMQPTLFNETAGTIAGNFYPVVNRIVLRGSSRSKPSMTMAVYTDRPQGGASQADGELELMIHRRLVRDDHLGVGEPLMENGADGNGLIVRGYHWLRVDETDAFDAQDRMHAELVTRPPLPMFVSTAAHRHANLGALKWSGLVKPLPANTHLLSLMPWPLWDTNPNRQILIRLENLDHSASRLSHHLMTTPQPQLISTDLLLRGIHVTSAVEMLVTADATKAEAVREQLVWPGEQKSTDTNPSNVIVLQNKTIVLKLNPGCIHTFILNYTFGN